MLTTGLLAWWTRRRRPEAFPWTAVAAGSLAAAHGTYWGVVQPVNVKMGKWAPAAVPPDWTGWRNRWEYGHAVRAGLVAAALAALTWSLVVDSDDRTGRGRLGR